MRNLFLLFNETMTKLPKQFIFQNFEGNINLDFHAMFFSVDSNGKVFQLSSNFRTNRSSRSQMLFKIDILRISQNLLENTLSSSLFSNKEKKTLLHQCFSENFVKFVRTPFLRHHSATVSERIFKTSMDYIQYNQLTTWVESTL